MKSYMKLHLSMQEVCVLIKYCIILFILFILHTFFKLLRHLNTFSVPNADICNQFTHIFLKKSSETHTHTCTKRDDNVSTLNTSSLRCLLKRKFRKASHKDRKLLPLVFCIDPTHVPYVYYTFSVLSLTFYPPPQIKPFRKNISPTKPSGNFHTL